MWLGEAKTPEGMRLYAIGDVHGCDAMLAAVHERIGADLAARPTPDHRIIHVGDYVDRGPDSAAVIARLAGMMDADRRVLCLRGNHDQLMLDFIADATGAGPTWLSNGGGKTLTDYGVEVKQRYRSRDELLPLAEALSEQLPARHLAFLEGLDYSVRLGDFGFCHAGIRPGVPFDFQDTEDLMWIRDDFLFDGRDHGMVVVHGHTPAAEPEVRPNRINVDTGAVYGGVLTALALEGTGYRFL